MTKENPLLTTLDITSHEAMLMMGDGR